MTAKSRAIAALLLATMPQALTPQAGAAVTTDRPAGAPTAAIHTATGHPRTTAKRNGR